MIGTIQQIVTEANMVIGGVAFILDKNTQTVLAINLKNTHYRTVIRKDFSVVSTNMSAEKAKKAVQVLKKNIEYMKWEK